MKYFLVDIGNVLADFNDDELLSAMKQSVRHSASRMTARDPVLDHLVESGQISDGEYVERLNQAKGLDWSIAKLTEVWSQVFSLNPVGRRLYEEAVRSGIPVYMLSNIAAFHVNAIRNNWPDFFDGAAGLFLSYQIGERKPHPEIYHHVLRELGTEAQDCFFIDDLPENIEAARSLGINAHHFVPEKHQAVRDAVGAFFAG